MAAPWPLIPGQSDQWSYPLRLECAPASVRRALADGIRRVREARREQARTWLVLLAVACFEGAGLVFILMAGNWFLSRAGR